jgi:hypothetical protein
MRRRKKWKAPNNPTRAAKQIFKLAFPVREWPKGYRVEWAGFMRGALGLCLWDSRRIILSYGDAKKPNAQPVKTLVHELVHALNGPSFRHGAEFNRVVDAAFARALYPSEVKS